MELNVLELKEKLDLKKITLIDVREDYELEICHIKNSKNRILPIQKSYYDLIL